MCGCGCVSNSTRRCFLYTSVVCVWLCVCVHTCPCRQVIYVGRMYIVCICGSVKSLCICKYMCVVNL